MAEGDAQDAIRELREALRDEGDHQFEKRLEILDRIGRRINDADQAIGELGVWLVGLTVAVTAEAVAIALLWWFR